jgi:hypothetical protein
MNVKKDRFEQAMNKLSGEAIIAADINNAGKKTVFAVRGENERIPRFLDALELSSSISSHQPDSRWENLAEDLTGGD